MVDDNVAMGRNTTHTIQETKRGHVVWKCFLIGSYVQPHLHKAFNPDPMQSRLN